LDANVKHGLFDNCKPDLAFLNGAVTQFNDFVHSALAYNWFSGDFLQKR